MDPSAEQARLRLTSRRHALERVGPDDAAAELGEIDAALARIEDGSFGRCELCRGAIGRDRLRALPEVRYCAACNAR